MFNKELKIDFTADNVSYQKGQKGVSKKTGKDYEINEAVIIETSGKGAYGKLYIYTIEVKSEKINETTQATIVEKIEEKMSFQGVPATGSKQSYYVDLEDLGL
jgi:hypothetical protein